MRLLHCAIPAVTAVVISGCSSGVEDLPLPAPGISGASYHLNAEFSNALNLPDRAKVRVGGADVGEVVSMAAKDYTAVVQMRIVDGIKLPAGTTAELRSATPLGDIFVSLVPPRTEAGPALRDGDTIPLPATVAAATVEDVLASTTMLVNGGVIRNLTRVLNGMGSAVGQDGEGLTTLIRESRALVSTMAARSDEIRTVMEQTAQLADTLNTRRDSINDLLNSSAPALTAIADNTAAIVDLVNQVGAITSQLQRFPSIQGTDTRSVVRDLNTISRSFNDASVDPRVTMDNFLRILPPALKLLNANVAHSDVDLQQVALGHIPDLNHLGDPAFTGPKRADWDNMVGSLRFVLTQLGDRVWGPNRGQVWGPPR
ncbi:MCE family protein [Mycolicibacterium sp. XJ870]